MADLTAPTVIEFEGQPEKLFVPFVGNLTAYRGMMLVLNAGYGEKPSDTAVRYAAGIYSGKAQDGIVDYAYAVANGAHPMLELFRGLCWIPVSGSAQTDVGVYHYLADSGTLTKTAGSKTIGYVALGYRNGKILIDMRHGIKVA